jgi:hypothetical protein
MGKADKEKKEYSMFLQFTDYNCIENVQESQSFITAHNKVEALEKFLNESGKNVEEAMKL